MKERKRIVLSFQQIFTYITALLFILGNGTQYAYIVGGNSHLEALLIYSAALTLLGAIVSRRRFSSLKLHNAMITVLLLAAYFAVYLFFSESNLRLALPQLAVFLTLVLYFCLVEKNEKPYILIAYRDIICIIASISLFFWFFGSILGLIKPSGFVATNWGQTGNGFTTTIKSYFNLHFEYEKMYIFNILVPSNRAIFVERAFAAFSFSIGWIYELFVEKNKSKTRLSILTAAMISTFSTTGMVVSIITLMLRYIFTGGNKKVVKVLKILIVPIIIFLVYFSVAYLLNTKFSYGHSAASRSRDFVNGFNAWIKSPFVGYGYANDTIHTRFKTGYSNSVAIILTQGGLALMGLYIYSIGRGVRRSFAKKDYDFLLFIIVFLIEIVFTAVAFRNTVLYCMIYIYNGTKPIKDSE